ncbi:MAG: hypothetical protein NXH84_02695 [Rhodobacteraceae bacterium]|nr:hypothetical protein [Paracoccaceae bacterium]
MSEHRVHSQTGLVDVVWRKDIGAIHLKWYSEYNENDGVQTAVRAALEFVNERHVRNWLVDVSESNEALSEKDYEWVSSDEFRDLVRQSTLERFVLIPPGPNSKQDTSWILDWEKTHCRISEKALRPRCLPTWVKSVLSSKENRWE